MKIEIAGYVLCDGIDVSPGNLTVTETRDAQVAKGLRWKKAKVFDRGNKTTVITFELNRLHESIGVAEKFMMTHGTIVPNYGTIKFTLYDGSSVYLQNAEIQSIPGRHIGETTIHNYTITGGEMSGKLPT